MSKKIEEKKDITIEEMQEIVEKRAAELTKSLNLEVTPLLFVQDDEFIVGYMKQPNRQTCRAAYDRMEKYGKLDAGDLILEACLIKEESDTRITDPSPRYNGINNWACIEAFKLIEFNISVTKKNMNLLK